MCIKSEEHFALLSRALLRRDVGVSLKKFTRNCVEKPFQINNGNHVIV